jgi:predicted PurR-regulated permease PerM
MPMRLPWPLVFQVLGVIAAVWLVVSTWEIWLLLVTSLVLASAVRPTARLGQRYHVPRGVTVLLVYLGIAALLTLMGSLLWPALSEQSQELMERLPAMIENVKGWMGDLADYLDRWGSWVPLPKGSDLQGAVSGILANTVRVTTGVFGAVVGLLVVLVITAYLVIDEGHIGQTLLMLVPARHRPLAASLAEPVLDRMGGYVRGQLVSSMFVGALIAIALSLLGVRYALLVGALAAVLNIVPFLGATVAAILGILSALNDSLLKALLAAVIMGAAQLVEGKFLAPHFVGRATGLHPLAVLLALLAGAHLAGLVGALVAIPLFAGAWEVVRRLCLEPAPQA